MVKSEKVIAYVDGFNLYFGLKEKGWCCYYWLNIKSLCQKLLKNHQHLVQVKYFTSRITSPPDKRKRQSTYIEALNSIDDIKLYFGKYQLTPWKCENCNCVNNMPEEKMTDVQIATELIGDAFRNHYDTALLLSADRDLVPAIEKVRAECPSKRVIVLFPPMRTNADLQGVAHGVMHITEKILQTSKLPDEIMKTGGYVLKCPETWH